MRVKILIIILITFILSNVNLSFGADMKIGYIDAQKILDESGIGKKTKNSMEDYVKSRQKIIDLDEEEIKNLENDLGKQSTVLSEDAKRDKQESIQKKLLQYQKKVSELNKEVQEKKMDVLKDFNNKLEDIVKKIAEKEGYSMIFDKSLEGGVVVYAIESIDITDKVVAELNKIAK